MDVDNGYGSFFGWRKNCFPLCSQLKMREILLSFQTRQRLHTVRCLELIYILIARCICRCLRTDLCLMLGRRSKLTASQEIHAKFSTLFDIRISNNNGIIHHIRLHSASIMFVLETSTQLGTVRLNARHIRLSLIDYSRSSCELKRQATQSNEVWAFESVAQFLRHAIARKASFLAPLPRKSLLAQPCNLINWF